MKKKEVISDAIVQKRLKKIQRRARKDIKKKVRKGQLTNESLGLYLGVIDEPYTHLRNELNTGMVNARTKMSAQRAELYGRVEAILTTLDAEQHHLSRVYSEAQDRALKADIPTSELPTNVSVSVEGLREKFDALAATEAPEELR